MRENQSAQRADRSGGIAMVLGVTGGIGCGKSTVLGLLASHYGARLLVADEIGHAVMARDTPAWEEIREKFGMGVLTGEGEIDREKMAALVFREEERRQVLHSIVHPRVFAEISKKLREWEGEPLVALETAILFETGCDVLCDRILWVDADRETRIRRLANVRGYSREKAEGIMDRQMGEEEWGKRCHYRIDNNRDGDNQENLLSQLKELLGRL